MIVEYKDHNNTNCYRNIEDEIAGLNQEIDDLQMLQKSEMEMQSRSRIIYALGVCILGVIISFETLPGSEWTKRLIFYPFMAICILAICKINSFSRFVDEGEKPLRQKLMGFHPELNIDLPANFSILEGNSLVRTRMNKSQECVKLLMNNFSMRHKELFNLKFAMQTELGILLPPEIWGLINNYLAEITKSSQFPILKTSCQ